MAVLGGAAAVSFGIGTGLLAGSAGSPRWGAELGVVAALPAAFLAVLFLWGVTDVVASAMCGLEGARPNGIGSGSMDSPAGAYTADPSLTGMATFDFVSRYEWDRPSAFSGSARFVFQTGNLAFQSVRYERVGVNQNHTNAQGIGTINGAGRYEFVISATDGSPDTFRIQITDLVSGAIVYDNGIEQPIASGRIYVNSDDG